LQPITQKRPRTTELGLGSQPPMSGANTSAPLVSGALVGQLLDMPPTR
jgi:hypothetical protein